MADYFKIKKDGDPIYELYLLERVFSRNVIIFLKRK